METKPQPQKKRRRSDEYIPTELLEKILLNLPVKSLTRFSSVSKSWNSTIHSPDFEKRYRGREMVVLKPNGSDSDAALVYPLSSILSGNTMGKFSRMYPRVRASCGELWCVEFDGSICLYNPTMGTCRKLPKSPTMHINDADDDDVAVSPYLFGFGYDSITDDYKVLAFDSSFTLNELYSKRGESWRVVSDLREKLQVCTSFSFDKMNFPSQDGLFVNGLLHWLLCYRGATNRHWVYTILSFDFSTEKYGKVAWPDPVTNMYRYWVELGVSRGKLCVYSDDWHGRGAMWVHDHQGLWTKQVVINYSHICPETYTSLKLKPLYSYYNSIKAFLAHGIPKILLYKDESVEMEMEMEIDFVGRYFIDRFTYVESMVKP